MTVIPAPIATMQTAKVVLFEMVDVSEHGCTQSLDRESSLLGVVARRIAESTPGGASQTFLRKGEV